MSWSIKPSGSWGVATTTSPATETATALARPGSWLYDTNPAGGVQRVYVRKDQWGTLAATPTVDQVSPSTGVAAGSTGVSLVGEGLIGSTGVTFGGTAATGVLANPRGNVTVTNGYTYV